VYTPLLGSASKYTGASLQSGWTVVHADTRTWINNSVNAGKPWVVANDEQGSANDGIPPDPGFPGYDGTGPSRQDLRHRVLWGHLMAGGAGVEAYFGYAHPHSDLNLQDFRSRDGWWNFSRHAKTFFETHVPFELMTSNDPLVGNSTSAGDGSYCLAQAGSTYACYFKAGTTAWNLDLTSVTGTYSVQWYDPRNGGALQNGTVTSVTGGGNRALGNPPNNTTLDWVALVKNTGGGSGQSVVTFTLINADTDLPISTHDPLTDGSTLNLTSLPTTNLNIRANTSPPTVGSVRFNLNGEITTESVAPYAMKGDVSGNYNPWTPTNGAYTLTATPYTGSGATGTAGTPLTINFTVTSGGTPPAAPSGLTATAVSSSQINLAWTDNANNETGFKIERKTGAGGTYSQIATTGANATTYNNTGLAASTTYFYRVRANNASGDSAYSNEASATTQSSGSGPFQQDSGSQGIVSMEAENFHGNVSQGGHSWTAVTTPAGFSGTEARKSTPDNGTNRSTGYTTNSPRLDFQVNFTKTGTHYLWVRCNAISSGNTCHGGIDGTAPSTAQNIVGTISSGYNWTNTRGTTNKATISVGSTGVHTVNIWMREDGFTVDKIVLTTDANFVPTGTGPAESPR
jgi:hypothetical protein